MDFLKDLSIDKIRNAAEDVFNQAKPKTETEAKLYEVLSHKNWGSSSSLLNDIARDTYDYDKFGIISTIMWESMENQRPAAWRVVFKGLTLLEHLVKNGSERCVDDARNHGHVLRSLGQFNYYEGTVDRGLGVREKSKQLIEILSDDERVREERMKARKLREKLAKKMGGVGGGGPAMGGVGGGGYGNDNWDSRGGGYGDGGIDSGRDFGGRYDNDEGVRSSRPSNVISTASEPTFATMPSDTKKKKKKGKKLDTTPASEPTPQPEIDLFSFDESPAPAPVAAPTEDDFGGFHSVGAAPANQQPDPFAAPAAPAPAATFDAFGQQSATQPPQQQSVDAFGAFGQQTPAMNQNAFAGAPMQQQPQPLMGGPGISGLNQTTSISAPAPAPAMATASVNDDEFGDFAAAGGNTSQPKLTSVATDPMSKLISLDGLSKNTKKQPPNKPGQPSNGNHGQMGMQAQNMQSNGMGMQPGGMMGTTQNMLGTASAGGSDAISGLMDPSMLQQKQQPQHGMGGNQFGRMQQGFGGMPQSGMNNMMGGAAVGGMSPGFGGMNQQRMMMNQAGSGMSGNNMGMQGMGGQPGFGGMQSMGGQPGFGGMQGMGGQPGGMQGFGGMPGGMQGMAGQQGFAGMQGMAGQQQGGFGGMGNQGYAMGGGQGQQMGGWQ